MIEKTYELRCNHCGKGVVFHTYSVKRTIRVARQAGWSINTNTNKAKCPRCKQQN